MATFELIMWSREFTRAIIEIPDELLELADAEELVDDVIDIIPDHAWHQLGAAADGGVDVTPIDLRADDLKPWVLDASLIHFLEPEARTQ